eukprot:TRINITY_DN103354_c0_g1_i1.p1 TRINITY_DN103354_c0_g1~~TRINITY_DN103354_c0_g1_i1.p1  ORF type:complete len:554 (+),score=95.12 TRINITY_DN103354_c0_g1_i1:94-1755(+)
MPPKDLDMIHGKQAANQSKKWVKRTEAQEPGLLRPANTDEPWPALRPEGKGSRKQVSHKGGKQGKTDRQKTSQHESKGQPHVPREDTQPASRCDDLTVQSSPELESAHADDTQTTATLNSQDGLNREDSTSALPEDTSAAASDDFAAKDVDEIADRFFRNLYSRKITVQDVIAYMRQSMISNDCKMQKVYHVMVTCLLDEIQHFPSWPQQELDLTAELMGQLLCWNLLPDGAPLRTALLCVICALHEPAGSPMQRFGQGALDQFKSRLHGSSLAHLHAIVSREIAQQVAEKQQQQVEQANKYKQQLELVRLRQEQLEHQRLFLHLASLKQRQTLLQQGRPAVAMSMQQAPPGSWTRIPAQRASVGTHDGRAVDYASLARPAGNQQMPVRPAATSAGYPAATGGPLRPGALCQGLVNQQLPRSVGGEHPNASRQRVIQSGLHQPLSGNINNASSSRWRDEDKVRREQAKLGKTKRNAKAGSDEKIMNSRQSRVQRHRSLNQGFVEVDEESMHFQLLPDDIEDVPLHRPLSRNSSSDSLRGLEDHLYGTAGSQPT